MSKTKVVFALAPLCGIEADLRTWGIDLSKTVIVPLLADVHDLPQSVDACLLMSSSHVARTYYDEIASELQSDWIRWRDKGSEDSLRHYFSYIYAITRTPIIHWRMTVEHAMNSVKPIEVYIYGNHLTLNQDSTTREDFLRWARFTLISEASVNATIIGPSVRSNSCSCRKKRRFTVDHFIDTSTHLYLKTCSIWCRVDEKLQQCAKHWTRTQPGPPTRFVVLGQFVKTQILVKFFKNSGVTFQALKIQDILGKGNGVTSNFRSRLELTKPQLTVDFVFDAFIETFVADLRKNKSMIASFVREDWHVFLTDFEHDPRIRFLVTEALEVGKKVVLLPEGAQTFADPEMRNYFGNLFSNTPGVTRFAVDSREAHFYKRSFPESEPVVTGYLALSQSFDNVLTNFFLYFVRKILRTLRSDKHLALVNFDSNEDLGLTRAGQPDLESEIRSLDNLVLALDKLGWQVWVTSKSGSQFRALRKKYAGVPVRFFSHVKWWILAEVADVVIQRGDSSLGPESQENGHPVIIWSDSGLPLISKDWFQSNPANTFLVSSPAILESALLQALNGKGQVITPKPNKLEQATKALDMWLEALDSSDSKN